MQDEKDHCDDTMRLLERAREDIYFAARDRELIDKFKVRLQKIEISEEEKKTRQCPNCLAEMERYSFIGFLLDRCQSCGGVWMDRRELEGLLKKATRRHLASMIERFISGGEETVEGNATGKELAPSANSERSHNVCRSSLSA